MQFAHMLEKAGSQPVHTETRLELNGRSMWEVTYFYCLGFPDLPAPTSTPENGQYTPQQCDSISRTLSDECGV